MVNHYSTPASRTGKSENKKLYVRESIEETPDGDKLIRITTHDSKVKNCKFIVWV